VRLIDPLSGQLPREHLSADAAAFRSKIVAYRAETAGPHFGALCQTIHQNLGAQHPRRSEPDEEVRRRFHRGALRPRSRKPVRRYLEHNPQSR